MNLKYSFLSAFLFGYGTTIVDLSRFRVNGTIKRYAKLSFFVLLPLALQLCSFSYWEYFKEDLFLSNFGKMSLITIIFGILYLKNIIP